MNLTLAVVLCVIILAFIYIFQWIIRRYDRHQLWKRLNIPGPKPSLLAGNLLQMKSTRNPHVIISGWIKKYGNIFGYYLGPQPYIVINEIEIMKKILIEDFDNFVNKPSYELDVYPLSKMLVFMKDNRWKEVRALLNKDFKLSKFKRMNSLFEKKGNTTMNVIARKIQDDQVVDLYHIFQAFTLDTIADSVYGIKDDFHADGNTFLTSVQRLFQLGSHWCLDAVNMFPGFRKPFSKLSHWIVTYIKLNDFVVEHVIKCIHTRKKNVVSSTDFLHLMLEYLGDGSETANTLTEEEIIGNSYAFLLAGFETTSSTLAHMFYLLAVHPDVQERLHDEVKNEDDITINSVDKLPLLDQVLKETLRLYPPVVDFVARVCNKDYDIGKCVIPTGTIVHIPVWHIHHDEKHWENPWDFNPERFDPGQSINTYTYLPFGMGRRHCIGQRFAEINIKLLTCQLIQRFRFLKCEKTDHPMTTVFASGVIHPAKGCFVQVEERYT